MQRRGQTLLLAILVVATLTSLGLTAVVSVLSNRAVVRSAKEQALARNIAEAGIEKALYELNKSISYTGESATAFGGGFFTTTVTTVGSSKQIDATGYYPSVASPRAQRTLRILGTISTNRVAFNYGVQVGIGGLVMDNNSHICGNIYTSGNVTGANGTTITGRDATYCPSSPNGPIQAFVSVGAVLDQQNTTGVPLDQAVGNDAAVQMVAKNFRPGATDRISQVALYIKKVGGPGSPTPAFVHIYTEASGSPSTTELARGILSPSLVTGNYYWVVVPLQPPCAFDPSPCTNTPLPTLTQGTNYWLALDSGTTTATDYWLWARDSNNGYGNGVAKAWDGATWTAVTGDPNFRTYQAGTVTQIANVETVGGDVHANTITGNGTITGDAYFQSLSGYTVNGTQYPGSVDPVIQPLPISDGNIADWKDLAATGTLYDSGLTISANQDLGPAKIVGNLTINNGVTVNLKGYVWVTGNITMPNGGGTVQIDPGFGSASNTVIADGTISIGTNWITNGSGVAGSYILFISNYSGAANALDIKNNADGAIFHAPHGQVDISNGVHVKEVTGYKLHLNNLATIQYDSGLASANFTTGPGASWGLLKGSWQELKP
jgi:hypothetical protein